MKKKLEADLISIAHRVLKLKGKEDTVQLHLEAQRLYEKLSILRFYEENLQVLSTEIAPEVLEQKLEQLTIVPAQTIVKEQEQPVETTATEELLTEETHSEEVTAEEQIEETAETIEESKESIEEESEPVVETEEPTEAEEPIFNPIFELSEEEQNEPVDESSKMPKQISLEDFFTDDYKDPEFIKVDDVPALQKEATEIVFEKAEKVTLSENKIEVTHTETFSKNTDAKITSLNDTLIKGINIGLNDRIAFVKHLFGGSNEDYNRVISQISTLDTFEEAQEFVDSMVKPDYNNWDGKEDYSSRFMNLVEKKFI